MAVAAMMGETPMLPLMEEAGTVEMPVFTRMTNSSALPSLTAGSAPVAALAKATTDSIAKGVSLYCMAVDLDLQICRLMKGGLCFVGFVLPTVYSTSVCYHGQTYSS
jgi:hypothetical protein